MVELKNICWGSLPTKIIEILTIKKDSKEDTLSKNIVKF